MLPHNYRRSQQPSARLLPEIGSDIAVHAVQAHSTCKSSRSSCLTARSTSLASIHRLRTVLRKCWYALRIGGVMPCECAKRFSRARSCLARSTSFYDHSKLCKACCVWIVIALCMLTFSGKGGNPNFVSSNGCALQMRIWQRSVTCRTIKSRSCKLGV